MKSLTYFCDGIKKTVYRTEEGDTLLSLAEKFNCPPSLIISDNGLTEQPPCGKLLYITRFTLPLYRVQPDDTAQNMAERAGISVQEFLQINKLKNANDIFFGQLVSLEKVDFSSNS